MKKNNFLLVILSSLLLGFLSGNAYAQAEAPERTYSGIWKVRPLQFGEYYISYENVKESDQSNEIGLGFIHRSFVRATEKDRNTLGGFYGNFLDEEEYAISETAGIVLRMSQRNYTSLTKGAPNGFYHGPAITYRFIAFDPDLLRTYENETIGRMYQHVLAFHYQLGYQFILAKHLSLDLFGGVGARAKLATAQLSKGRTEDRVIGPVKVTDKNSTLAGAPALHLNLAVGYAF
ncbi:hypothetical protein [Adhaeribacter soli]|uniref:DUF3575 domain-containing protein n=1 Tax=Adhaeribacter soli TaxID=2607655 RepID=A0A5N1J1D5_9BACT|nr:hypothetical protein [Adhaeribacter soli]KAA9340218.1 hypothetical protein F0P94_07675 [Adhaeribacter soli]